LPIPGLSLIGGLVGAFIGGTVANKIYNSMFPREDQDATALTIQIFHAQQDGQPVPAEVVFAALAAGLPDRARKRVEKDLMRMTGIRDLNEAVAQGKLEELGVLMRQYDTDVRADTGMRMDVVNIEKTASQQYAEWVNSGQLDARNLLFPDKLPTSSLPVPTASRVPQNHGMAMVSPSLTPGMSRGSMGKSQ
jgi:hypothetical protein